LKKSWKGIKSCSIYWTRGVVQHLRKKGSEEKKEESSTEGKLRSAAL